MKSFSFFPYYTRSQRRGVMLLFLFIILMQGIIICKDQIFPAKTPSGFQVPIELQQEYDSLKTMALQRKTKKIYPFNPNYLTDYRGYYLGMSVEEIDKVWAYRKQGKYFQNKMEFKQVSGISDSLYNVLEPYINIPVYKRYKPVVRRRIVSTTDINRASISDLQTVKGVGEVLSKRIVKYRKAIGGFKDKKQLNKVYGLEPEVVQRIWKKFQLTEKPAEKNLSVHKLPINTATAEDLKKVYGIGEKLSRRIVNYRDKLGGFTVEDQLNEVYGLSPEVTEQIWKQFKIENPNRNLPKINLNEANIIELAKNPYISYQLAKKIVSYRTINGAFTKFGELLAVEDYPVDKHKLICLYLTL